MWHWFIKSPEFPEFSEFLFYLEKTPLPNYVFMLWNRWIQVACSAVENELISSIFFFPDNCNKHNMVISTELIYTVEIISLL